jgi:hypothetical protein
LPHFADGQKMLSLDEEDYIQRNAYVPEHVVGLMTYLSGGEPFLIDDHFCCRKEDWIIVVGYPLNRDYQEATLVSVLEKVKKRFGSTTMWVIAPRLPPTYEKQWRERENDRYFTLDIKTDKVPRDLRRTLNKARNLVRIERSRITGGAHRRISQEFIERATPHPRIKELLFKSLDYVGHSEKALVLNAWEEHNELSAFYVIDLNAQAFSTYVIGCHSKKNYAPGASDLLLLETIQISAEMNKAYIHLGLGVNEGVRRFKEKWGGKPTLPYEMAGITFKRRSFFDHLGSFPFLWAIGQTTDAFQEEQGKRIQDDLERGKRRQEILSRRYGPFFPLQLQGLSRYLSSAG